MIDSPDTLHALIERYFAAETTLAEEHFLRDKLAGLPDGIDPVADEAKAVLGFVAVTSQRTTAGRKFRKLKRFIRPLQAAASVALIVGGAAMFVKYSIQKAEAAPATAFVAYVDGQPITDADLVRRMALDNMRLVAEATSAFELQNSTIINCAAEKNQEINSLIFPL